MGEHDESYGYLLGYTRVIMDTNSESKAHCDRRAWNGPERQFFFSSISISFTPQWKGYLEGCRSLIGVDGTHLKGNYKGILLLVVALDDNNEYFPIAYAVVST